MTSSELACRAPVLWGLDQGGAALFEAPERVSNREIGVVLSMAAVVKDHKLWWLKATPL